MFEIVDGRPTDDDGRTDAGRTPEHGYTISSPCEPNGSGELKMILYGHITLFDVHSHLNSIHLLPFCLCENMLSNETT